MRRTLRREQEAEGQPVAGRIDDEDIARLRDRADIGAVVGDYTALQRAGTRLKGLCPFHSEKTPSFTVDPGRGLYHCFGCGEGGDVYGFLQRAEALSFPEAVERLARIVGYELRYREQSPGQRRELGKRSRLTRALSEAARFYAGQLDSDEAEPARAYLAGRGLGPEQARRFRLGWAPDRWDALARHLLALGFEPSEIEEAGLVSSGPRGPRDRFRGRVIFPIFDAAGKDVVAFGGRVVPGMALETGPRDGEPPKYINSSESPVYKKSATLYALNWARGEIARRQVAVVVEGYTDVIGLHLAGVGNVVATCGTALTAEHLRLLEKFATRVVLALDADDAGYAAAERARTLAAEVGIREVMVLPLPSGQDPADLAARGVDAVEAALGAVKTAVEFSIEHLLRSADVSTPEGQVEAYRRTFPLLGQLGDRFLRYSYVRDLVAPAVRLSADRIEGELDEELARRGGEPAAQPEPSARPAPARSGPGDVVSAPRDPQLLLEREVLRTALQTPELLPAGWAEVTAEDFRAPMSRTLFTALSSAPAGDLDAVLTSLPDDELRSRVRALALSDARIEADAGHVAELVARLRAAALQREADVLREEVAAVAEQLPMEQRRALTSRLYALERRRRELVEGVDA